MYRDSSGMVKRNSPSYIRLVTRPLGRFRYITLNNSN